MDLKTNQKKYHRIIISVGFGAGLLAALDATEFYILDLAEMSMYIKAATLAVIAIAGYTYYELFWEARFKKRASQQKPERPVPAMQGPNEEAKSLEDINPPEERGGY